MKILILNGPNLNLLGKREPGIYGVDSFESYLKQLEALFPNVTLVYVQSNVEGELINRLQQADQETFDGIVFNAGGYTHTSVALGDAIAAIETAVIEVHISNVHAREEFRHQSLMAAHCKGIITGFGLQSYALAIRSFLG